MTEPLGVASPHYYQCALSVLIHLNPRGQSRPADETNDASCLARSQPARDALSPSLGRALDQSAAIFCSPESRATVRTLITRSH